MTEKTFSTNMSILTNSLAIGLSFLGGYALNMLFKNRKANAALALFVTLIFTILVAMLSYYIIYWTFDYVPMSLV